MEGFTSDVPFSVAVSWLPKNANGTLQEVPLLNAKPFPFGLLAETQNVSTGVTTRWFVPWTSVVYIKQDQPTPPAAPPPVIPLAPTSTPLDTSPVRGS